MNNLCDLFYKISMTSSTKEKKQLLSSFEDKERLKKALFLTYDPDTLFRITSKVLIDPSQGIKDGEYDDIPLEAFQDIINLDGTNAKIKYICSNVRPKITYRAWKFFLNILDRDLGIGIKKKLINSVFPELIKEFLVMLAERRNKEAYLRTFTVPWVYVNLKIDGIRCVCDFTSSKPKFYSREGFQIPEFLTENIANDLIANKDKYFGMKLDGEIYCDNFQRLMTVFRRENINSESIAVRNSCKFAIFDFIKELPLPLETRVNMMMVLPETKFIKKVTYIRVKNDYDLICNLAKKYIDSGHEGIIVKNPQGLYVGKRSLDWMKFKNKETEDCKIIKFYPGEGKYLDKLGGFVVDFGGKELGVGSGYTDAERKEFWDKRDFYIGKTMEISFMEKTKDELARHPVFERMRLDKENPQGDV